VKKALIITYYWPPSGGAGVQRWLKFVKYMRHYGWEPIVYTALGGEMPVSDQSLQKDVPTGVKVIRRKIWEPYSVYKFFSGRKRSEKVNASFLSEHKKPGIADKLSVWLRGNFFIPDARRFWIAPSIRFLTSYLKEEAVDAIISTGPPHSMHLIAAGIKKRMPRLKWLADFRDPWTHIDFYDKLMLTKRADKKHRRLELEVLQLADRVVSIGEHMSMQLMQIYSNAGGKQSDKFSVIPNGYDEDDLLQSKITIDKKFSLAHIGTLVKDRNAPELWRVLSRLAKEKPEFASTLEIKLVGKVDIHVKEQLSELGLQPFVKYISYLSHEEVIVEQQRSRTLLLLVNRSANSKGILTGKFYEYMASGRPILAIGPTDGELAGTIRKTNTGLISDFEDEKKLEAHILALYAGAQPLAVANEVAEYSRKRLTEKLCLLLDSMSK
jgi:glycosyltransferase involved in cell wall biosynthesis